MIVALLAVESITTTCELMVVRDITESCQVDNAPRIVICKAGQLYFDASSVDKVNMQCSIQRDLAKYEPSIQNEANQVVDKV